MRHAGGREPAAAPLTLFAAPSRGRVRRIGGVADRGLTVSLDMTQKPLARAVKRVCAG